MALHAKAKAWSLVREPDAGNLPVRFDERDVETEAMDEPLRHRQTKEAATDMFYLTPPRHISTLPKGEILAASRCFPLCNLIADIAQCGRQVRFVPQPEKLSLSR